MLDVDKKSHNCDYSQKAGMGRGLAASKGRGPIIACEEIGPHKFIDYNYLLLWVGCELDSPSLPAVPVDRLGAYLG
jgi:hypothetical protein